MNTTANKKNEPWLKLLMLNYTITGIGCHHLSPLITKFGAMSYCGSPGVIPTHITS